jgi:hypothetical protein
MERRIATGPRVQFERALEAQLMAIDGTWRRDCIVHDVSDGGARLTVSGSMKDLNLTEFFLSFTTRGLAYRRCQLRWVNGENVGVKFIKTAAAKKQVRAGDKMTTGADVPQPGVGVPGATVQRRASDVVKI